MATIINEILPHGVTEKRSVHRIQATIAYPTEFCALGEGRLSNIPGEITHITSVRLNDASTGPFRIILLKGEKSVVLTSKPDSKGHLLTFDDHRDKIRETGHGYNGALVRSVAEKLYGGNRDRVPGISLPFFDAVIMQSLTPSRDSSVTIEGINIQVTTAVQQQAITPRDVEQLSALTLGPNAVLKVEKITTGLPLVESPMESKTHWLFVF